MSVIKLPDEYLEAYLRCGLVFGEAFYASLFRCDALAFHDTKRIVMMLVEGELIDPCRNTLFEFKAPKCCGTSLAGLSIHSGFEDLFELIIANPRFFPMNHFMMLTCIARHNRFKLFNRFMQHPKLCNDSIFAAKWYVRGAIDAAPGSKSSNLHKMWDRFVKHTDELAEMEAHQKRRKVDE